jgi:hypothetical protein
MRSQLRRMKMITNSRWLALCNVTAALVFTSSANASTYECRELERVSVAAGGMMQPAYPGRELVFTRNGNIIESNGVFFHQKYVMTPLGEEGFRAYAENDDRTDIFRLEDGILFHSAIVKYGDEPSVQSQVFSCALRR